MHKRSAILAALSCCLAAGVVSCAGDDSGTSAVSVPGDPSRNVTQGGPQDIGEFRRVLSQGKVPDLELLDDVGFFAEHALDLPAADCGDPLCVHPMLAVAPRFDGGNWSMAFVALNTALDPLSLPRAPRHLILVLEDTDRTRPTIRSFATIADALYPALRSTDRVSVIFAGETAMLVADAVPGAELLDVLLPPVPSPKVDLYFALSAARDLAFATDDGLADRIVLFTSGVTDTGIHQIEPFADLGQTLAQSDIGVSTIGMGTEYRSDIPMLLADIGSGNYYFVQNAADLEDAVVVETETAFVPLATNLELTVEAQAGYHIGRIYGARRAIVSETTAVLSTPTLYLGAREGATDVSSGRRGGGGGWFVELRADVLPGEGPTEPADAFVLRANYEDAQAGGAIARTSTMVTPLGVGQNPDPTAPFFSDADRAKAFMMLNMYLALRASISLYESGDCSRALGVPQMMTQSYDYWSDVYSDPDIDADWQLLQQLADVIAIGCEAEPVEPPEFDGGCFMF